jgi:GNAT superfamily N-acetyltransferase
MQHIYQDKALIVDILCKAFDTNTSVNYIVKQDNKRALRIKKLMEYSFDICSLFGNIYLSTDKKACALTFFPDRKKTTLQTILWDIQFVWQVTGIANLKRVIHRESQISKGYPADGSFLYLWFIGVDPENQHRGKGSALLTQIIHEAKDLQRPLYLETSSPHNVRFYQQFGFEVYKQLQFGHTLYAMRKIV